MRSLAVVGVVVLASALPMLAGADAHDARWIANGVADGPGGPRLFTAEWQGVCERTYHVTLRDPETLAVVEERVFPGYQLINDLPGPPTLPDVFVLDGHSVDPAVQFAIGGLQVIGHGSLMHLSQGLDGAYQGRTFAAATVLATWAFC
jgi:hypothetical protein